MAVYGKCPDMFPLKVEGTDLEKVGPLDQY